MKVIQVRVKTENAEFNLETYPGQNLLELLQKKHIFMPNICKGNGTCGKCKVKVLDGQLPITAADKRCLIKEELVGRLRLSCKAQVEEDLCIEILEKAEDDIVIENIPVQEKITIQERNGKRKKNEKLTEEGNLKAESQEYFIAIDIGTTTIAMAMVNETTGKVCDTYSCLNHQRQFGADVISRIAAANEGKGEELKQLIEKDLWKGIQKLTQIEEEKKIAEYEEITETKSISDERKIKITKIVIVGNTAMIHMLMGYSCESLGKYPFESDHLSQCESVLKQCIAKSQHSLYEDVPVIILPCISVFVGADVVADMMVCPGFETEEINLLIDLGTNGEMVLGNKDRIVTTSVAAGPAFEGGNIKCGIASVPGAISKVKIENQRAVIKTLQNVMPPVGICGSGLISAIAQLKKNKIMDDNGGLQFPYNQNGFSLWKNEAGDGIALYQKDIREFQMAKAAVRAGIEILMEEFGCTAAQISNVYLAGGLGNGLSVKETVETGILPVEFLGRIEGIGNGALLGAISYGKQKEKSNRYILNKKIENISLAKKASFQEKYVKAINFVI